MPGQVPLGLHDLANIAVGRRRFIPKRRKMPLVVVDAPKLTLHGAPVMRVLASVRLSTRPAPCELESNDSSDPSPRATKLGVPIEPAIRPSSSRWAEFALLR